MSLVVHLRRVTRWPFTLFFVVVQLTSMIWPAGPAGPCTPAGPCAPVDPGRPAAPVSPVDPVAPVAPVAPVGPVGPAGPEFAGTPVPDSWILSGEVSLSASTTSAGRTPTAAGVKRTVIV